MFSHATQLFTSIPAFHSKENRPGAVARRLRFSIQTVLTAEDFRPFPTVSVVLAAYYVFLSTALITVMARQPKSVCRFFIRGSALFRSY